MIDIDVINMGMYTQVILIAEIKTEFIKYVDKIIDNDGKSWELLPIKSKSLKDFLKCERYSCIPFGTEIGFYPRPSFNKDTGRLIAWFALKDYDDETELFYEVLKEISDEIICYKTKLDISNKKWFSYK